MSIPRILVLGVLAGVTTAIGAIERLPVEDFTRTPTTSHATLAPDGKHLAFLREVKGRERLHVMDVATGDLLSLNAGTATLVNDAQKSAIGVMWVNDNRLLLTTAVWDMWYGMLAVDRDGRRGQAISGYEDENYKFSSESMRLFAQHVIYRSRDDSENILMLDYDGKDFPDVIKMCTRNGEWGTEVKNPGKVRHWGVDSHGVVRYGALYDGEHRGAIYRENEKAPWRTLPRLRDAEGPIVPEGFDAADNKIFVDALTKEKRWTLFELDPATGELSEPLLEDPEYDIVPQGYVPRIAEIPLNAVLLAPSRDRLLGVRYVTDAPRVKWFDPSFAKFQMAVDRTLPDTVNILVDISADGKRMLWFGYSDQNPGVYLMLDLEKRIFKPIARRMAWIKPPQMARTLVIKYRARDGLVIHGFLTVPVGHEAKGLPLIVMPHGGPWARDVWGYDPLVQFLANRGYAVLQMNYRGSPGYGEELSRSARQQVGRKIQDDIEDATRWAVAAGVADPKRIAICGGSYGGYSALFALGHNPDLYRCGISIAGVTDWPEIYGSRESGSDEQAANRYWRREIGDPDKDSEFLRSISPVYFADKISAPVLILQGKEDEIVPGAQARRMIKALETAGHPPQSKFFSHMGHNYGVDESTRTEVFRLVEAFLAKNLGPGVN